MAGFGDIYKKGQEERAAAEFFNEDEAGVSFDSAMQAAHQSGDTVTKRQIVLLKKWIKLQKKRKTGNSSILVTLLKVISKKMLCAIERLLRVDKEQFWLEMLQLISIMKWNWQMKNAKKRKIRPEKVELVFFQCININVILYILIIIKTFKSK